MTCFKCDGTICQDKMYDLPKAFREYFCVNCGQRFWVDMRTLTLEFKPVTSALLGGPARN